MAYAGYADVMKFRDLGSINFFEIPRSMLICVIMSHASCFTHRRPEATLDGG